MSVWIESEFRYCPRCGAEYASPGTIPFRCARCGFTQFFGPVAAVGGLILNDQDELLLVRRARDPGKGQWGLPGGFIDRGETAEEALRREVIEETQLTLQSTELLVTFPNEYNYRGTVSPVIDLFYICRTDDPTQIQLEPTELDAFEWTRPRTEHLDNMAFPSNRRAIELWLASKSD